MLGISGATAISSHGSTKMERLRIAPKILILLDHKTSFAYLASWDRTNSMN